METQHRNTGHKTAEAGEWTREQRLVDVARSRNGRYVVGSVAVISVHTSPSTVLHPFAFPDTLLQACLEFRSFSSTELVARAYDVASVRVGVRIETLNHGEHFCSVAATAEDDKEACGLAAVDGRGTPGERGEAREDEYETGLW